MCEKDPSFSKEKVCHWNQLLEESLERNSLRFDCAKIFGEMLNEWIGNGDSATAAYQNSEQPSSPFDTSDSFLAVGWKELHYQQEKLESLIFQERKIDAIIALKEFLKGLFSGKQGTTVLDSGGCT
jgi:hypothetical protein